MRDKRGLSEIVTAVILILLVISAVALIWSAVKTTLEETSEGTNTDAITTNVNIVENSLYNSSACNITFKVSRPAGNGEIVGIKVVVKLNNLLERNYDFPKNTSEKISLNELETKEIVIEDCALKKEDISAITVYPVFENNKIGIPSRKGGGNLVSSQPPPNNLGSNNTNQTSPVPKGARLLGIEVTNTTGSLSYDLAFDVAKSFGTDFASLSLAWDWIEIAPGIYDSSGWDYIDWYYPTYKNSSSLALVIAPPIDTNVNSLPYFYANYSFNDTIIVDRYEEVLNFTLSKIPNINITYLSIGNEIDVYLADNMTKWDQYIDFYNKTSKYVKQNYPNILVGSKATHNAFKQDPQKTKMQKITDMSDVVLVTYYLKDANFIEQDPQILFSDMDYLDNFSTKQIYLTEIGYSSSSVTNSSEQKQKLFYENLMQSWDSHINGIKLVNILWLHDRSQAEVDYFKTYYGLSSNTFAEHIRTLGIRNHNETDKLSAQFLRQALSARGW